MSLFENILYLDDVILYSLCVTSNQYGLDVLLRKQYCYAHMNGYFNFLMAKMLISLTSFYETPCTSSHHQLKVVKCVLETDENNTDPIENKVEDTHVETRDHIED